MVTYFLLAQLICTCSNRQPPSPPPKKGITKIIRPHYPREESQTRNREREMRENYNKQNRSNIHVKYTHGARLR